MPRPQKLEVHPRLRKDIDTSTYRPNSFSGCRIAYSVPGKRQTRTALDGSNMQRQSVPLLARNRRTLHRHGANTAGNSGAVGVARATELLTMWIPDV